MMKILKRRFRTGLAAGCLALMVSPEIPGQKTDVPALPETLRIDLGKDYAGSPVASANDFAVASDGTIYILDTRGGRVLRFDAGGKFLGAFGKPGQGPGDLERPLVLALSPSGEVVIGDNNLSVFSGTGRFLRRRSDRLMNMIDAIFPAGTDGFYLSRTRFTRSDKGVVMEKTIEKTNLAFDSTRILFRRSDEYGGGTTSDNTFFSFAPGPGGEIFVLDRSSSEYRILAFDLAGKPRPDISRPFRPIAKCPEDLAAEKDSFRRASAGIAAREGGSPSEPRVNPNKFAVGNIFIDQAGRLWATTCGLEPCDRTVYIDVFDSAGVWRKRFRLDSLAFPRIKIEGHSLYALESESGEELRLVRYDFTKAIAPPYFPQI